VGEIMLNSDSRNDLSHWSINIDDDHIAWLQIQADGKSVNVLTHAVMDELAILIDELEAADNLAGLALLSGKPWRVCLRR
jgi:enoyl-CoA hydratase/carnithine racemase